MTDYLDARDYIKNFADIANTPNAINNHSRLKKEKRFRNGVMSSVLSYISNYLAATTTNPTSSITRPTIRPGLAGTVPEF